MIHDPNAGVAAEFNPVAPPQLDDPYTAYARARREAPAFFSPIFGAWVVSRYEDIAAIAKDLARFSSRVAIVELPPEVRGAFPDIDDVPSLVNNDPPDHTRLRALLSRSFTPQQIATTEPRVRSIAGALVDRFAAEGSVDIMERFAFDLPLTVIVEMIGAPIGDRLTIKRWSDEWLALNTPGKTIAQLMDHAKAALAFRRYLVALIERRRREPREDIVSRLLSPGLDGEAPATEPEIASTLMQLLFAGHETVTSLLGAALLHLLGSPEQLAAVREDRGLLPAVVEETLRLDSPNQAMFRVAAEDAEVGGARIAKGDRILLLFASANRDEARFRAPDTFDIRRDDVAHHLAFGRGPHFCIGAALARIEARIALEVLLDRLPNLRLRPGQPLAYSSNLILRGLKRLDLVWDRA